MFAFYIYMQIQNHQNINVQRTFYVGPFVVITHDSSMKCFPSPKSLVSNLVFSPQASPESCRILYTESQPPMVHGSLRKVCSSLQSLVQYLAPRPQSSLQSLVYIQNLTLLRRLEAQEKCVVGGVGRVGYGGV